MDEKIENRPQTPREAANEAGLRYVSDEEPGIRRRRCGKGFTYMSVEGSTERDPSVRERITALVVPPAWQDVWICAFEDGHIQATGRDEQGRKQYLYHARWRAHRDVEKYRRLQEVGRRLPALRTRVTRKLSLEGTGKERVVAGAVRLLDRAALRVGSEAYAEENESYGITTLLKEHVELSGKRLRLKFDAKGGVERNLTLSDAPLARLVADLEELPGDSLFRFRNGNGNGSGNGNGEGATQLRPEHVNDYLRDVMKAEVTAKDFRTWAGTVQVLRVLASSLDVDPSERDRIVLEAVDAAAERLGNLRATARQFYVHPGLIRAFEEGELADLVKRASPRAGGQGFRTGERLLLALLPELDELLEGAD